MPPHLTRCAVSNALEGRGAVLALPRFPRYNTSMIPCQPDRMSKIIVLGVFST